MIDLETLDTGPKSVVLSVGAVLFDERGSRSFSPFYRALELDPQFALDRTVSQSTLLWWMGQSPVAQGMAFSDVRTHPAQVMLDLTAYAGEVKNVWANSPSFDCIIWESLCRDFVGLKAAAAPWKHGQVRDVRTFREESGMPRDWAPHGWADTHTEHDPIDDCRYQITVVREARRRITNATS